MKGHTTAPLRASAASLSSARMGTFGPLLANTVLCSWTTFRHWLSCPLKRDSPSISTFLYLLQVSSNLSALALLVLSSS